MSLSERDPELRRAENSSPAVSPVERPLVRVQYERGSHNEDLVWIIRQFKERAEASGIAVVIQYENERAPQIEVEDLGEGPPRDTLHSLAWLDTDATTRNPEESGPALRWRDPTDDFPWHTLVIDMASNHHSRALLSAFYPAGSLVGRAAKEFVARRFQPVLTGYFKLWLLHRSTTRRMHTIISGLSHVDFGVIVLDSEARIVFENPAAALLLDEGSVLRRCRGSISTADSKATLKLRLAIDEALSGRRASDPTAVASSVICVKPPRTSSSPVVTAVTPVEPTFDGENEPAAVVHIFKPLSATTDTIAPICEWYGLSTSEARLVAMLVSGKSVAEMAAEEKLNQNTARTYLKNIFRKTGARNQADLVRLIMSNPVRMRRAAKTRLKSART